jgi:hypothetical protein
LVKDRNAPQKHIWRAQIVLLSTEGVRTNAIMRETSESKTCVWLIGTFRCRRRGREFIRFLNTVEGEVPVGKTIHAIIDNYAAYKPSRRAPMVGALSALDLQLHANPRLGSMPSRLFGRSDQARPHPG